MAVGSDQTDFAGTRGQLFGLALRTGVLTVLTLGFYRFWMKTRLRRFYWSAIRPGGVPLEYTGHGVEKLLGFLIAVVFLAFYIGIVNLILMFASFAIFHGNVTAYVLSFVGVLPLLFFAQYRARRYILARTRWRGIRFGIEPGAWGYSLRALGYWLLTIVTLGFAWPVMTFQLEKYRTDRTYFGSARLHQGGSARMLVRPFLHVALAWAGCLALTAAVFAIVRAEDWPGIGAFFDMLNEGQNGPYGSAARLMLLYLILVPWLVFGLLHYKVQSFRVLSAHKSAGPLRFQAAPSTGRVLWIYLGGYTLTYLVVTLFITLLIGAGLLAVFGAFGTAKVGEILGWLAGMGLAESLPVWLTTGLSVLLYFAVFIFWGVFAHTFVTLPILRHYVSTLRVFGAEHLGEVSQRARDEFAEAEGFAEALDLGAAI